MHKPPNNTAAGVNQRCCCCVCVCVKLDVHQIKTQTASSCCGQMFPLSRNAVQPHWLRITQACKQKAKTGADHVQASVRGTGRRSRCRRRSSCFWEPGFIRARSALIPLLLCGIKLFSVTTHNSGDVAELTHEHRHAKNTDHKRGQCRHSCSQSQSHHTGNRRVRNKSECTNT